MKICLKCHNRFKPDINPVIGNNCPIEKCNGKIVEVEDCMINVIEQLNKKGYPTLPSAIHSGSEFVEINFDEKVHPDAFVFLPNGFNSEISDGHKLRLYKLIIGETEPARIKYITGTSIELSEWIEKLSNSKKIIVDLMLTGETDAMLCISELYQRLFLSPEDCISSARLVTIVSPERVELVEHKIWPFVEEIGYEFELQIKIE